MNKKFSGLMLLGSLVALACSTSLLATPTPQPTATAPATATATLIVPSATLPAPSATVTAPAPAASATSGAPSGGSIIPGSPSGPYAIVLVLPGDVLNIRSGPGVGFGIVGSFSHTATGVMRTGPSSQVGDSLWVEVQNPSGGRGWVNSNFLTEYVPSAVFCADPKVTTLLDQFKTAIVSLNGDAYSSLVSPAHGLDLRYWRYGTVANYNRAEARFVFTSTFDINWGPAPGSGEDSVGTFSEVPLPKLLEVLNAPPERHCNNTLDLATFSLQPWPAEYTNVNFYTLYKPGSEIYGGMDWRSWLVGVEYVNGQPYLFALIHFQWEP
jgi:hypothetical protein